MNFDELEELIRKYLSAGITAIVVIVSPGNATGNGDTAPEPDVRIIEPRDSSPAGADNRAPAAPDRTGAGRGAGGTTDRPPSQGGGVGTGSRDPSGDSDSAGRTDDGTPGIGSSGRDSAGAGSRSGNGPGSTDEGRSGSGSGSGSRSGTGSGSGSGDSRSDPSDSGADSESGSGSGSGARDSGGSSGTGGGRTEDDSPESTDDENEDTTDGSSSGSGRDSGSATEDTGTRSAPSVTGDSAGTSTGEGVTAAERFGWGTPNREDDFSNGLGQWNLYDGPGHAGNGTRSPSAATVQNGMLTITGDSSGTTAGMAWNPGQKYGRWEGRVKAPASDPSYHALLLLWPDAENFPVGGEIDFMEMLDHTRQVTDIFVHYGEDNSQVNGQVEVDATEWHNWAVEWTPEAITAYVDGEEWYRTTDTSILPPGPMHLCIQLDWFPEGDSPEESTMYVDWVRQYSIDETSGSDDGTNSSTGSADRGTDSSGSDDGSGGDDGSGDGREDTATRVREAIRRLFFWR
jgi:hypothetical protein